MTKSLSISILLICVGLFGIFVNGFCVPAKALEMLSCVDGSCPAICTLSGWSFYGVTVVGVILLVVVITKYQLFRLKGK